MSKTFCCVQWLQGNKLTNTIKHSLNSPLCAQTDKSYYNILNLKYSEIMIPETNLN